MISKSLILFWPDKCFVLFNVDTPITVLVRQLHPFIHVLIILVGAHVKEGLPQFGPRDETIPVPSVSPNLNYLSSFQPLVHLLVQFDSIRLSIVRLRLPVGELLEHQTSLSWRSNEYRIKISPGTSGVPWLSMMPKIANKAHRNIVGKFMFSSAAYLTATNTKTTSRLTVSFSSFKPLK